MLKNAMILEVRDKVQFLCMIFLGKVCILLNIFSNYY